MKTFKTPKGTDLPLLSLQGKDYLQVQHRILWFREEHEDWSIETDVVVNDELKRSVASAIIRDTEGRIRATAHKMEDAKGFGDYIEKSETGAIGRALALCGYGTQFTTDLEEGERIVDSPTQRPYTKTPSIKEALAPVYAPAQSPPQAKVNNPGEFITPFGRDQGWALKDLDPEAVRESYNWWLNKVAQDNKPAAGRLKDYMEACGQYLATLPPPQGKQQAQSVLQSLKGVNPTDIEKQFEQASQDPFLEDLPF